jgi:DNA-binding response OmpR family regulator
MPDDIVILIAEHESLISLGLQQALEGSGYTVCAVRDGVDAMPEISRPSRDIAGLITDVNMGCGPSGWEVARYAREVFPGLPVVYMSGASLSAHTSRGVPDSIMIQKPFAYAQMLTAISTLLGQPAAARA